MQGGRDERRSQQLDKENAAHGPSVPSHLDTDSQLTSRSCEQMPFESVHHNPLR